MLLWRITERTGEGWIALRGDPDLNYERLERRYRALKQEHAGDGREFRIEFRRISDWEEYH